MRREIPLAPAVWKKAAVGMGNASKAEVMAWADGRYTFKVDGPPPSLAQDAADALGVAVAAAQVELEYEAA